MARLCRAICYIQIDLRRRFPVKAADDENKLFTLQSGRSVYLHRMSVLLDCGYSRPSSFPARGAFQAGRELKKDSCIRRP